MITARLARIRINSRVPYILEELEHRIKILADQGKSEIVLFEDVWSKPHTEEWCHLRDILEELDYKISYSAKIGICTHHFTTIAW